MSRKVITLLSLLSCIFLTIAIADEDKKVSPVETITLEEIKDHMYFLASDELGGRVLGTPGYEIAAKYAVSQFRAAGIKPILKDKDGKDTYLQEVPVILSTVNGPASFNLITPSGTSTIGTAENLKLLEVMNVSKNTPPKEVVFVGFGIEEPEYGWNDLEGLDLEGKLVIVMGGAPTKDGKPVLPEKKHNRYKSMMGFQDKLMNIVMKRKAMSLLVLPDKNLAALWMMIPDPKGKKFLSLKSPTHIKGGLGEIFVLLGKDDFFKDIFAGQEYNPLENPEDPMDGYKPFVLKDVKMQLQMQTEDKDVMSWNVVGVVEGTDPQLKKEYVSLAGHLDHIDPIKGKVCNGADDNASGSIGVIEIGEALAMAPPKRSVLLALWAGEEKGLLGSMHFVNNCPVGMENITVNLNLDMIGRTDKPSEATGRHYALGAIETHPTFQKAVEAVNQRTYKMPLAYSKGDTTLGGSDHMNFQLQGVPSICFYSGPHKDYHKTTDDPDKIEWQKMLTICKLNYELALEFGNTDVDYRVADKK